MGYEYTLNNQDAVHGETIRIKYKCQLNAGVSEPEWKPSATGASPGGYPDLAFACQHSDLASCTARQASQQEFSETEIENRVKWSLNGTEVGSGGYLYACAPGGATYHYSASSTASEATTITHTTGTTTQLQFSAAANPFSFGISQQIQDQWANGKTWTYSAERSSGSDKPVTSGYRAGVSVRKYFVRSTGTMTVKYNQGITVYPDPPGTLTNNDTSSYTFDYDSQFPLKDSNGLAVDFLPQSQRMTAKQEQDQNCSPTSGGPTLYAPQGSAEGATPYIVNERYDLHALVDRGYANLPPKTASEVEPGEPSEHWSLEYVGTNADYNNLPMYRIRSSYGFRYCLQVGDQINPGSDNARIRSQRKLIENTCGTHALGESPATWETRQWFMIRSIKDQDGAGTWQRIVPFAYPQTAVTAPSYACGSPYAAEWDEDGAPYVGAYAPFAACEEWGLRRATGGDSSLLQDS
jgi:hypothetical protein